MAEVLLTQAVNEAEEAIESGNYGGAIEACQRILGQFPEFAGAHRIMGEACAEQGDLEAAREAFQRTLERDPQSIAAHVGLGMLAEDAGDNESALAYYQVGWEIDPRRRDLREHVSRLSQLIYGADGRLYLTRAALASLHFHAGRWDRAVSEAAQVLQGFSSRIDIQVRLAEALWRRGDDAQAKQVSSSILRALPSAVVPLLMLADIHRREGDWSRAQDYLKQARDIDPDGVRASDLIMVGFDEQADFLAVDAIPTIDDQLVHEEPARYAPAPDFTAADSDDIAEAVTDVGTEDVVVPDPSGEPPELPDMEPTGVQPFQWEDLGDEDLEVSDLDVPADDLAAERVFDSDPSEFALPSDEELEQARPSDDRPAGFTGMLDSLESEGMEPFDPGSGSGQASEARQAGEGAWDELTLPSDEELERSRPSEAREPGFTGTLESLESEGMEPFDPFAGEAPPVEEQGSAPEESLGADDARDSGASELEPDDWTLPSDEELEAARPDEERPAGFTGMLDSLESEGMQPFDPGGGPPEMPVSSDVEVDEQVDAPEEEDSADGAMELSDLGHDTPLEIDWSRIDEEIEDAKPGEMPRGYTDELRSLDDYGLEPFAFEPSERDESSSDVESGGEDSGFDDLVEAGEADDEVLVPGEVNDVESIGVMFGDEELPSYAETEPLRADPLSDDESIEAGDALAQPEVEEETVTGEAWDVDDGFEQLISEASSLGADWPAASEVPEQVPDVDGGLFVEPIDDSAAVSDETELVARETWNESGSFAVNQTAVRLGFDEALIDRAREAKQALIAQGRISGSLMIPGSGVSAEGLRAAVEKDPWNIDQRIAFADRLMDDRPDEALEQYRWVYRHAPERSNEIVQSLTRLIDVMREREVGVHRLMGALYRRHGDWALAASHYEESLSRRGRRSAE